jgi:hypothetical protein
LTLRGKRDKMAGLLSEGKLASFGHAVKLLAL